MVPGLIAIRLRLVFHIPCFVGHTLCIAGDNNSSIAITPMTNELPRLKQWSLVGETGCGTIDRNHFRLTFPTQVRQEVCGASQIAFYDRPCLRSKIGLGDNLVAEVARDPVRPDHIPHRLFWELWIPDLNTLSTHRFPPPSRPVVSSTENRNVGLNSWPVVFSPVMKRCQERFLISDRYTARECLWSANGRSAHPADNR